jgi:hypothetical protein
LRVQLSSYGKKEESKFSSGFPSEVVQDLRVQEQNQELLAWNTNEIHAACLVEIGTNFLLHQLPLPGLWLHAKVLSLDRF